MGLNFSLTSLIKVPIEVVVEKFRSLFLILVYTLPAAIYALPASDEPDWFTCEGHFSHAIVVERWLDVQRNQRYQITENDDGSFLLKAENPEDLHVANTKRVFRVPDQGGELLTKLKSLNMRALSLEVVQRDENRVPYQISVDVEESLELEASENPKYFRYVFCLRSKKVWKVRIPSWAKKNNIKQKDDAERVVAPAWVLDSAPISPELTTKSQSPFLLFRAFRSYNGLATRLVYFNVGGEVVDTQDFFDGSHIANSVHKFAELPKSNDLFISVGGRGENTAPSIFNLSQKRIFSFSPHKESRSTLNGVIAQGSSYLMYAYYLLKENTFNILRFYENNGFFPSAPNEALLKEFEVPDPIYDINKVVKGEDVYLILETSEPSKYVFVINVTGGKTLSSLSAKKYWDAKNTKGTPGVLKLLEELL